MANRTPPSRTFNTVKHSNRDKRNKKSMQKRALLLGMMTVSALLVLMLLVFAVCSIVASVKDKRTEGAIEYQDITQFSTDVNTGALVVINQSHSFSPSTTSTASLVTLNASNIPAIDGKPIYGIANNSIKLHSDAKLAFDNMMKVYGNESPVTITSAYRAPNGTAGNSDHQSGYLLALGTADGAPLAETVNKDHWIFKNCHKYGFVIRYPEGKQDITGVGKGGAFADYDYTEAIRYVGVAHATYMTENNLCLEEYVERVKNYSQDSQLKINGTDGNLYSVYYVPAASSEITQFKVPSNYQYEVSGNNASGFIVTVNLSAPLA